MIINKLVVKNYKQLRNTEIDLNPDINVFVGENDSGKSTVLEALTIACTGKINGYAFDRQLKADLFNNEVRNDYIVELKNPEKTKEPPSIIIEIYSHKELSEYRGTNNGKDHDVAGIRVAVEFDSQYEAEYKNQLLAGKIDDIPIEYYTVKYHYFSGSPVTYRTCPIKAMLIDTTNRNYSFIVDRFISENISNYLSQAEQVGLSAAFRSNRKSFREHESVQSLNERIKQNPITPQYSLSIDLVEEGVDAWKNHLSVIVGETPFHLVGRGTQNIVKVELVSKSLGDQVNMIFIEEPENNLTYANMAKLINSIESLGGKQLFVSTHSSYVANKLSLSNLILMRQGNSFSFSSISPNTINYFKKLPGYDTLRLVLAEKVILVEGPTEELLLQKAYLDQKNKLPLSDGIDIIVVNSLAFKRFCDLAILLRKKVVVVTDNDGSIEKNITTKYSEYLKHPYIHIKYEKDESLPTVEDSVVKVNSLDTLQKVITKQKSNTPKTRDEMLSFMKNNKTEWALRVFDSDTSINYPTYLRDAINEYS